MWAPNTCGEPNEIELTIRVLTGLFYGSLQAAACGSTTKVVVASYSRKVGSLEANTGWPMAHCCTLPHVSV